MKEIIDTIVGYHSKLQSGKLNAQEIEPMLQVVRDLEEYLIVLRYKAFTNETEEKTVVEAPKKVEEIQPEVEIVDESPVTFNFGTPLAEEGAPQEEEKIVEKDPEPVVSPNQTSLIDAIAEMQDGNVSINDKMATESENTLADKLRKAPIEDLKSAIGLNQKFWFISNLFDDNAEAYNGYIDRLNNQDTFEGAMAIVNNEIREQFNWHEVEDKSVSKFLDFVERRYMTVS